MGVRSEYQKHFKVSALRKSLPIYYENVAFRTARREREYAHTPLSWNDDEDADSVDADSVEDVQLNKNDEAKDTKAIVKSVSEKDIEPVEEACTEKVSDDLEQVVLSDFPSQKTVETEEISKEKKQEKCAKHVSPKVGAYSKTFVIKPGRQRRPDRKQKIPTRPHSKQSSSRAGSRPQTATPRTVEHPAPFISYGWGDIERDLCQHKTFNVRASADVHPAALRAQSRRKTAAERRSASVKKSAEDKVKALMEAAAQKRAEQGIEWRSEYQQRYPAYDKSEYIRSISARSYEQKLNRVVYVS